jgi:hypothetical protein
VIEVGYRIVNIVEVGCIIGAAGLLSYLTSYIFVVKGTKSSISSIASISSITAPIRIPIPRD